MSFANIASAAPWCFGALGLFFVLFHATPRTLAKWGCQSADSKFWLNLLYQRARVLFLSLCCGILCKTTQLLTKRQIKAPCLFAQMLRRPRPPFSNSPSPPPPRRAAALAPAHLRRARLALLTLPPRHTPCLAPTTRHGLPPHAMPRAAAPAACTSPMRRVARETVRERGADVRRPMHRAQTRPPTALGTACESQRRASSTFFWKQPALSATLSEGKDRPRALDHVLRK